MSFGYTAALWQFWRACGFTLVRIGSQREASSGCYAAMAICALTPAGEALQQRAAQRLARLAVAAKADRGAADPVVHRPSIPQRRRLAAAGRVCAAAL